MKQFGAHYEVDNPYPVYNYTSFFNGIIDEVSIYDYALTNAEILALYQQYAGQLPTANFTYTPVNPMNKTVIQFTDTSFDSDGTIVSWWWNFGDHYYSDLQNPVHCYYVNGTYTTSLTVTDDSGGTDTYSLIIIVQSPVEAIENLIDDVLDMELPTSIETALLSKLNNAINFLNSNQPDAAISQLEEFINKVEAQRGKKITEEQADYLVGKAQAIIDSI